MKQKKILITGANGFIGSHLQAALSSDYEVILTSRTQNDAKTEYLNLLDETSVEKCILKFAGYGIDAVIHTAGRLVDGTMTEDEQMQVFYDNLSITNHLVKLIRGLNIGILLNCSSIAVYPNRDGEFAEDSEIRTSCNAECMYGLSKFCAENIFDLYLKGHSRVINLRLAQVYGPGMREDRIIPIMKDSVRKKDIIEVYGNGERGSNFVHVDRVCRVVGKLLQMDNVEGIYNLGGENLSYLQLARKIVGKYGQDSTRIVFIDKGSKAKFRLDTKKMDALLEKQ